MVARVTLLWMLPLNIKGQHSALRFYAAVMHSLNTPQLSSSCFRLAIIIIITMLFHQCAFIGRKV